MLSFDKFIDKSRLLAEIRLNSIVLILILFDVIRTVHGWDISKPPMTTENDHDE